MQLFARQPFICDEDEAKLMVRKKVKQHKEVLVAVLDCSVIVPELFQRHLITQVCNDIKSIPHNM